MAGVGKSDANFYHLTNARKVPNKKKSLYIAFVDLEKTFRHVPRKFIWLAVRVVCTSEWIVFLSLK